MFSNRGIASQSRAGDLNNFFAQENHAFQVSPSEYGKLRGGTKSDFLDCLKSIDKWVVGRVQGHLYDMKHQFNIKNQIKDFLRVKDNKKDLFKMIADVATCKSGEGIVICTKDEKVLVNRQITKLNLKTCNHEKSETRLFAHARDAALNNMQKVMIIGNDTDIIAIALYIFCDLKTDQLWIEYGCGKNHWWLPIHNYVKLLGEEKCRALPFLYVFIGYNSVSSLCGRGKKTAWDVWSRFPKLINAFRYFLLIAY